MIYIDGHKFNDTLLEECLKHSFPEYLGARTKTKIREINVVLDCGVEHIFFTFENGWKLNYDYFPQPFAENVFFNGSDYLKIPASKYTLRPISFRFIDGKIVDESKEEKELNDKMQYALPSLRFRTIAKRLWIMIDGRYCQGKWVNK